MICNLSHRWQFVRLFVNRCHDNLRQNWQIVWVFVIRFYTNKLCYLTICHSDDSLSHCLSIVAMTFCQIISRLSGHSLSFLYTKKFVLSDNLSLRWQFVKLFVVHFPRCPIFKRTKITHNIKFSRQQNCWHSIVQIANLTVFSWIEISQCKDNRCKDK